MQELDFECMIALANTGSITAAANHLHLTQPTLSKRISALEAELGVPLLLRSRSGIRFTPQGEKVLAASRQIRLLLSDMRQDLDPDKDQLSGSLSLGISVDYAQYRLPSVLADFHKLHPAVSTSVSSAHSRLLYNRLIQGDFDAAIIRGDFPWGSHQVLLSEEAVCAIMDPRFHDLPYHEIPYINRRTDTVMEHSVSRWLTEQNLNCEQSSIRIDSIITCVEMVKRGLGWAIVPEICLKDFDGIVRPLTFADGSRLTRRTYLMYTDLAARLPQVQAFVRCLRSDD